MTATEIIHEFSKQNMLPERYLLGELKGMDLEDFERHMWECQACFEEVKAGQELKQHLAAGVSAPALGWWQRLRKFWDEWMHIEFTRISGRKRFHIYFYKWGFSIYLSRLFVEVGRDPQRNLGKPRGGQC
jgi:hypothetical protein